MNRELLENLHQYFEQKENKTGAETSFLIQLTGELPYFKVTSVHRDDLALRGFDVSNVDDEDMRELARKMGDDYCEQLFWSSMEIIAQDRFDIPKYICPFCGKTADGYDSSDNTLWCNSCSHSWEKLEPTDRFVKVEHPDDSKFYSKCEVGYYCCNSDDNGAMYVPENFFKAHENKEPHNSRVYIPVQWPESQQYFELQHTSKKKFDLCEPIEHGKAFAEFGSQAIWVPLSLIQTEQNGNK